MRAPRSQTTGELHSRHTAPSAMASRADRNAASSGTGRGRRRARTVGTSAAGRPRWLVRRRRSPAAPSSKAARAIASSSSAAIEPCCAPGPASWRAARRCARPPAGRPTTGAEPAPVRGNGCERGARGSLWRPRPPADEGGRRPVVRATRSPPGGGRRSLARRSSRPAPTAALHRRAGRVTVGAEDTAVARQRLEHRAATGAAVEEPAGVHGHRLAGPMAAGRATEHGLEHDLAHRAQSRNAPIADPSRQHGPRSNARSAEVRHFTRPVDLMRRRRARPIARSAHGPDHGPSTAGRRQRGRPMGTSSIPTERRRS